MKRSARRRGTAAVGLVWAVAVVGPATTTHAVDTDMSIDTTSIDFGEVNVGSAGGPTSVTLTNTGGDPFGPINIFGGAPPTAEFNASQNCQGTILPAGGSCSVVFTFAPGSVGSFNDTSSFTISETNSQNDGEDFSVSLAGVGVDPTATTTTTAATTTTTTTSTTEPATTTTDPPTPTVPGPTPTSPTATATTAPLVAPTVPGPIVIVPGPLSDGGNAQVIAQGIVAFPDGSLRWDHQLLDMTAAPFTYQQSPPMFLATDGPGVVLSRIGDQSSALLDTGEAVFVPVGARGDLAQAVPGGTATAHRIAFVASTEPFSFVPGAGNRDVNLIRVVLDPGDAVHVVSPFPVLVIVVDGVVVDAPEGLELGAGTARPRNDADLTNASALPATVLIAAVGGQVP